jgi:hypothetical protein
MTRFTDAELGDMRDTVAAHFPDVGVITRGAAVGAFDATTGLHAAPATTTVYSGPLRVRRAGGSRAAVQGDTQITVAPYILSAPWDAGPFLMGPGGDVLTVTTSADPHITARSFRLVNAAAGSNQLDQRIEVEEIDSHG